MKKIKIIIAIACVALCAASCAKLEKKILTVQSIGKSTIASFFAEVSGLEAAGQGLHSEMEAFFDSYYIKYGDIMGDMLNVNTASANDGDYFLYTWAMRVEYVATYPRLLWNAGWSIVTAANNIIYYGGELLEGAKDGEKATIRKNIAWGYFARGLAHWCLCNCYAQPYNFTADHSHIGVPVVTHIPGFDEQIPRESVAKVYKQVLEDVKKALDILGEEDSVTDPWRISGLACEALLARIYLYMQDWDNAALYSSKVMAKVPLTPRSEYVDMFRNPMATPGKETILRMNQFSNSSTLVSCYDPTRSDGNAFFPCPALTAKYSTDDIRKDLMLYIPEATEPEQFQGHTYDAVCKYCPYKSLTDDNRIPCPFVFRGSEMYLIHAEAIAKGSAADLAGAVDDLKALEARARGIDKSAVTMAYTDLASVNALIMEQRQKELCFEGHALFDYIRQGQGIHRPAESNAAVKDLEYGNFRCILPIDQTEMEANDYMEQNDGYKDQ
ncbi:MAG: RagB/SusD family nutrient uptake outer membrane protein [Bacteroidales bacterium]|nr:RagB/SusD family nutrient uptake outer membrane protein [Bacteroidales bacterium]